MVTGPGDKRSPVLSPEGDLILYRVREGDYRIIYEITDEEVVIVLLEVGHRKDVCRRR